MLPVIKKLPILLLTKMLQIGKSTLFDMLKESNRKYVSLDNFDDRDLAKNNPALFIQKYEPPVIIDEVHMLLNYLHI